MWASITTTFPALSVRQYTLFFSTKILSDLGTWMQRVVQGYLVYEMTGSPLWVGVIDALQTIPFLFFVFLGGIMLDRLDRKKVLLYTQLALFFIAGMTGVLLLLDMLTIYILALCAFCFGIADALNQPARMMLAPLLVPRDLLRSAISLNSTAFNIARIIGPMCAAFIIALGSPALGYIANALSFLPVCFILNKISFSTETVAQSDKSPLQALKDSARHVYNDTRLFGCLLQFAMFGFFGWSYLSILPVIAKDSLGLDAAGLGTLYTAVGVGAVVSGLWVASAFMHTKSTARLLYAPFIFSLGLFAFALTDSHHLALIFLAVAGFGQILQNATLHTQVQLLSPEAMRGRISSIQTFLTDGSRAFGSFLIGAMAEFATASSALIICAIAVSLAGYLIHQRYLVTTATPSTTR